MIFQVCSWLFSLARPLIRSWRPDNGIRLGRIVRKMSYEGVHIEAVESRAKGEKPEVGSVDHTLERQDVILVQSVRGRLAS